MRVCVHLLIPVMLVRSKPHRTSLSPQPTPAVQALALATCVLPGVRESECVSEDGGRERAHSCM